MGRVVRSSFCCADAVVVAMVSARPRAAKVVTRFMRFSSVDGVIAHLSIKSSTLRRRLLLELEGDTALRDGEPDALRRRGQRQLDAVRVYEPSHPRPGACPPPVAASA